MDKTDFWEIIHQSKKINKEIKGQIEGLTQILSTLSRKEIIQFGEIYQYYLDNAYTADLWDAAFLLECGCSDDAFLYFRSWLIYQGYDIYNEIIKNPDNLAEIDIEDKIYSKSDLTLYAVQNAYKHKTGNDLPNPPGDTAQKIVPSKSIQQKKMKFPRLAEEFRQNCE